jgi:branched-chain amino acid transport system substrate-binding protein
MKRRMLFESGFLMILMIFALSSTAFGFKWPWQKDEAPQEIRIGVIGPMNFTQGQGHWNGAVMAADEINAKGGVKVGEKMMKIKLLKADSNEFMNMADATNAMERVITSDKADFIVGGFRTEAVLAMQDIAMDYKKIFIGCGAADDLLCKKVADDYDRYKYWFRGTPFKSSYLGRTVFIHLATAAALLRKELGIARPKVAIVAEKQAWVEKIVAGGKAFLPKLGMEVVGVWQPSQTASDVTAELSAIQSAGADIVFTVFSASVGITFAKQMNELQIPAMQVGINVESQKDGFHEATGGKSDYVMTMNTYARGVIVNDLTEPFVEGYIKKFGEVPTYTADTYSAIVHGLVPAIEAAGTLDSDKVVQILEKMEYLVPSGKIKYSKDHDLTWGPGYLTSLGVQWQNGELKGVWPNNWVAAKGAPPVTYKGLVPIQIPPWMIEKYKK